MYAKGMTTRDISSHIEEIYGFGLSETMISKITNKVLPTIEEWQNRPLERVYPKAEIKKCVIHQIRNLTKYVSCKDVKELTKDLKTVYKAPTEELASTNLDIFEDKWGTKYPICVKS